MRLVVVQGEQPADDGLEFSFDRFPATRGDCGPRPCPHCSAVVAMRLTLGKGGRMPKITCPECSGRVDARGKPGAWAWVPYDGKVRPERLGMRQKRVYAEALNHCRPCPWVRCSMHTYLDPAADNVLRFNFPDKEPQDLHESCALDVADRGGATLEQVGEAVSLTRERVRQIIEDAKKGIRKVTNPLYKSSVDMEDVDALPSPHHHLADVE